MVSNLSVVLRIKEGDIGAFEKLFREYYEPLCRYAASLTKDMDAAEEIVQELFYTLWKERESLRVFLSLKSYLYGAVRNNALQYLEHRDVENRYQEQVASQPANDDLGATPLSNLEYKELESRISAALATLPERRRTIFRLHRFEGKKYTEIAREMSLSVKTVEAEMTKALSALRKVIDERN